MFNKLKRNKSLTVKPAKTEENCLKRSPFFNRRATANPALSTPNPESNSNQQFIRSVKLHPLYQKQARSNLERRISLSLDDFRSEDMEGKTIPKVLPNLKNNRKSLSLGNVQRGFGQVVDEIKRQVPRKHEAESQNAEFTSTLENFQESRNVRTPRFPVESIDTDQEVELRSNDRHRSPRSQTLHIMPEVTGIEPVAQRPCSRDIIEIRSPKWTYDGQTREKVPLLRLYGGQLTVIKDDSCEVVAKNLLISKKSTKKLELVDNENKTYVIKSDSIKDGKQAPEIKRERSNSLNEKPVEKKKNILQKLLKRRSNRDLLERKGILMNEEIFGNTLTKLYEKSKNVVPAFVKTTIALIETDKNIRSEHIYRIPGNLAIIQKIRVHVDRNNLKILEEYKNDPDVLTGALKLFFRELKEPLIPHRTFEQLMKILEKPDGPSRSKLVKSTIERMESPHRETLETLIDHLLKVESHTEENKMNIHSLSIVWGPSLLWALDYTKDNVVGFSMSVNKVIELILSSYKGLHKQTERVQTKNENRPKTLTDTELDSIGEEELVKISPKSKFREISEQLKGLIKTETRDKIFGSNLSLASSYDNECAPKSPREDRFDGCCCKLESLPKRENTNVPDIIWKITAQIEKNAVLEGIYTQPGDKEKVMKLKKKSKIDVQKLDVHDLTCWLKTIISELEEPLMPTYIFEEFIKNYDVLDDGQKRQQISSNITNLNSIHQETIDHLMHHLLKILSHQETNKLNRETLSIIWAPVLYLPLKIDKSEKRDLEKYLDFLVLLLKMYEDGKKQNETFRANENFKHKFKIKGGTVTGMSYKDGDDVRKRRDGDEMRGSVEYKETQDGLTSEDNVMCSKVTPGMLSAKLQVMTRNDTPPKKKTTNKDSKKPLSYYDNVPAEVYRDMDKSDL